MISFRSNMQEVLERIKGRLVDLRDEMKEDFTREVATDVLSMMTERIHEEGKAADGRPIGSYSERYMKVRMKKYNRTSSKKVIVSLTRRLENDWGLIPTEKGWGIGFLNMQKGTQKEINSNLKMEFVEINKGVKIASLTEEERDYAINKFNRLINEKLS